jgi:hypothetical protein
MLGCWVFLGVGRFGGLGAMVIVANAAVVNQPKRRFLAENRPQVTLQLVRMRV